MSKLQTLKKFARYSVYIIVPYCAHYYMKTHNTKIITGYDINLPNGSRKIYCGGSSTILCPYLDYTKEDVKAYSQENCRKQTETLERETSRNEDKYLQRRDTKKLSREN